MLFRSDKTNYNLDTSKVKFECTDKNLATIDENGVVTPNANGRYGITNIIVSADGMDFIKIIKVGIKPAGAVAVPQVAVGRYNTVALKADGTVWTWGNNATGQLGNGTKDNSVTPIQVMNGGKPLGNIIMISTGGANRSGIRAHVLALSNDGTIWSWGDNVLGQVGNDGETVICAEIGRASCRERV